MACSLQRHRAGSERRSLSMSEKKDDHVLFSSAWLGNIVIIAVVVLILGAAFAYIEYF
jgi:hypothetical protein